MVQEKDNTANAPFYDPHHLHVPASIGYYYLYVGTGWNFRIKMTIALHGIIPPQTQMLRIS